MFRRPGVPALIAAILAASVDIGFAETGTRSGDLVPTGKGWGVEIENAPQAVVTGNGIDFHGGSVLSASTVKAYFIWYGNWTNGPKRSDRKKTVNLIKTLFGPRGIGGSSYEMINSTYGDDTSNVSGNVVLADSRFDKGSQGTSLSDFGVGSLVSSALTTGALPTDPTGIYFVLTSSDISETSFCSTTCGWHGSFPINGANIKFAFVGNPDRCPACEAQPISPNGNSGADGMANVMAHEAEEMISDPNGNAWYDAEGEENADKCQWKYGPVSFTKTGAAYNQTFAGRQWLIQMNWENSRGGGCAQTLGGPFYTQ